MFNKDKTKKIFIRPYLYIQNSIGTQTFIFLILLLLQVFLLGLSHSFKAIIVITASTLGSVLANTVSKKIVPVKLDRYFSYYISIIQGLITGMLIPETYPPITVLIITFCTMIVAKYFFGGFSYSLVNPSILSVAILWIIGSKLFGSYELTFDILCSRNPSQLLIENGLFPQYSFDHSLTEMLNNSIFSLFRVSIPEGYISLLWDSHSIIPAFRFNFVSLISSIIIFSTDNTKMIVPICFTVIYILLVRFISPLFFQGIAFQGDMILALLTSGTLFITTFVINWYGTIPSSIEGLFIYGITTGIIAFFVAGCGMSPSGMIFTVLVANINSIIIQHYENKKNYKITKKLIENLSKEEL